MLKISSLVAIFLTSPWIQYVVMLLVKIKFQYVIMNNIQQKKYFKIIYSRKMKTTKKEKKH